MVRRLMAATSVLALGAIGSVEAAQSASAATVACTTSSLITGISSANATPGGGTVTLTKGCVYTLTSANNATDGGTGLPVITGKVTIQGAGATITRSTASGTPAFRVFDVASKGNLNLNSLTLSNGLATNGVQGGGAIYSHGALSVTGGTFTNNSSPATTGTSGGAIDSSGTLSVDTSTFSGNSAQEGGGVFNQSSATITNSTFTSNNATIYGGGALLNAAGTETLVGDTFVGNTGPGGGAIDNDATLNIANSTFYNNTGGTNGGGAVENFGTTTLKQSTFSGNTSPYGANIFNYTGFKLSMSMDIVAGGLVGSNCGGQAPITDLGYNIDTGSSCHFTATNHSLPNTQPELDALASNGGSTQTMGLPAGSPAIDAIPPSTPGCTGSTDQRGITRPQGKGCDIGAYEVVATSGDTTPPSVPTGLAANSVTSSSVSLKWNASSDNVAVTGYTIYRNGAQVGSTAGATATTFTDSTVSPSAGYQYTVDAFDGSGNHSARSAPVSVTTPAPTGVQAVQAGAAATATRVTSTTIVLSNPVRAGDLLAGWLGQYDAAGQVQVSDNVNGAWTRSSASTTFSGGGGDLALFYVQNSAAAPWGLDDHHHRHQSDVPPRCGVGVQRRRHGRRPGPGGGGQGNRYGRRFGTDRFGGGGRTGGRRGDHRRIARDRDAGLLAGPAVHPAGSDQLGLSRHRGHCGECVRSPGRPGHLEHGHGLVCRGRRVPCVRHRRYPAPDYPDRSHRHIGDGHLGRPRLGRLDGQRGGGRLHRLSQRHAARHDREQRHDLHRYHGGPFDQLLLYGRRLRCRRQPLRPIISARGDDAGGTTPEREMGAGWDLGHGFEGGERHVPAGQARRCRRPARRLGWPIRLGRAGPGVGQRQRGCGRAPRHRRSSPTEQATSRSTTSRTRRRPQPD